jgi:nucleoside-diphosphate-sugar epimerase
VTTALIGHTGFVGGNLARQHRFDDCFNSSNIESIRGRAFDLIVCAGVPAEKWKANADPDADSANISRLARALEHADAARVVLISTVDVFASPIGVDETTAVSTANLHAYGRNRRHLEELVAARFHSSIVRLPALYGPGLKKNAIFDLMHQHEVHKIDSRGVFQFYGVTRLWADIEIALDNDRALVHLATEPVSMTEVVREAFGREFVNEVASTPARYDVRTRYAELFGGRGAYVEDRGRELAGLRAFVRTESGS